MDESLKMEVPNWLDGVHGIGIYALDKGHMNDVEWLKSCLLYTSRQRGIRGL